MIDKAWLETLEFDHPDGYRVHGLYTMGGENILLRTSLPDGKEVLQKVRKHHLGFHIREIPLFLTGGEPRYSFDRLNKKVLGLVGNPLLDGITGDYDRLYTSVINLLKNAGGVPHLLLGSAFDGLKVGISMQGVDSEEAVQFLLCTRGIERRFRDWATLPREYESARDGMLTVNGPNFPFTKKRGELIDWANATLAAIGRLPRILHPETLEENPLYVWGAAVTDGFFTDDELPRAADFLNVHFGTLCRHPRAVIFLGQAKMIAHLLGNYLKESEVARFVAFCGLMGFALGTKVRNWPTKESEGELDNQHDVETQTSDEGPKTQDGAKDPLDEIPWEFSDPPTPEDFGVVLGASVAHLHLSGSHGDLHPGNVAFNAEEKKIIFYDWAKAKFLNRPLTAEERAQDLLPLKLHCEQKLWQAVWFGYSATAPNIALGVHRALTEILTALELLGRKNDA